MIAWICTCKLPSELKDDHFWKIISIGIMFGTAYMVQEFTVLNGPAVTYLMIKSGWRDYVKGSNVDGLLDYIIAVLSLPVVIGFTVCLCLRYISKHASSRSVVSLQHPNPVAQELALVVVGRAKYSR